MREYALPSAAGHKITATSTAASLQDLIRSAVGGGSQFVIPPGCDSFEIDVESGSDVRILTDGNTPTATNGNLITIGEKQGHEGINLGQVKLIRAGSLDAVCNIRIGQSGDEAKSYSTRSSGSSGSSGGSPDVVALIGKNSGGDFTVAYASATTLTLGTYPDGSSVTADDIVQIDQFTSAGVPITTINRDDNTMSMSGNVLTVTGANFTNGDVFVIYTNVPRSGTTSPTVVTAGADAVSNTQNAQTSSARISGFNGTTWDRIRAGITTVTATLTGFLNTLPWGVYNATPSSRTEGQGGPLQTTARGAVNSSLDTLLSGEYQTEGVIATVRQYIATNTFSVTRDISAALEASTVSKNAAGNWLTIDGRLDSTAPTGTYYVQFLDATSLPSNGSVTMLRHPLKIQHISGIDDYFSASADTLNGFPATTGIVIALSTTEFTLTNSGPYLSSTVCVK